MTRPTVDLATLYAQNDFENAVGKYFCWNVVKSDGTPWELAFTAYSNLKIMNGTAEAAGNQVVDIACVAVTGTTCCTFFYPTNLQLEQYHVRINFPANATLSSGAFDIQEVSARGGGVNVTASAPIGCGPGRPPTPFTPISSLSSSAYISVYMQAPMLGANVLLDNLTSLAPIVDVQWNYRDARNSTSAGISNFIIQVMDSTNGSNVGLL
ncbi:hypothetical protein M422DRAFT_54486 [Sphaerobolus stellatus SS14]|uniref:Uncharacterized protein n=1 Tax=Sphaerobolus stellatus (strain SS14) TaxID=990650 RepID=A0A0C9UTU4_SPHS4|nr:hypothetical protein M422DRAFT_54486 [Sphaerobolus stellatus SS14]